MVSPRLSSSFILNQGVYNVQNNQLSLSAIQQKIATQKSINKPSDDPTGMVRYLQIDREQSQNAQFAKNISAGQSEVGVASDAVTSIIDIIQKAKDLAVQAANGTNGPDQRDAIQKQVDGLIGQMVNVGNSTYAGRYIFSGFKTDTPPLSKSGNDIAYAGSPTTAYQRTIQIAANIDINVNLNGDDLMGHVAVTAPGSAGPPAVAPTFSADSTGLALSLTRLKLNLANGDTSELNKDIDRLGANLKSTLGLQSTLAGATNQMTAMQNRIDDRNLITNKQLSDIMGVDMPKALSDMNFAQTVYEASVQTLGKILQSSVVNFLS